MTTAVIGATGRIGSEIVRGVLARGDAVTALVRDPGKARRAFGEPGGLHIRPTRLDDPRDLAEALDGIRTVFIAIDRATGTTAPVCARWTNHQGDQGTNALRPDASRSAARSW